MDGLTLRGALMSPLRTDLLQWCSNRLRGKVESYIQKFRQQGAPEPCPQARRPPRAPGSRRKSRCLWIAGAGSVQSPPLTGRGSERQRPARGHRASSPGAAGLPASSALFPALVPLVQVPGRHGQQVPPVPWALASALLCTRQGPAGSPGPPQCERASPNPLRDGAEQTHWSGSA